LDERLDYVIVPSPESGEAEFQQLVNELAEALRKAQRRWEGESGSR